MKRIAFIFAIAVAALTCGKAWTQETAAPVLESALLADSEVTPSALRVGPDFWEVRFMAYGWLPSTMGHAGVGSKVIGFHISMDEVVDNLNLIDALIPLNLEVRAGNWGILSDLLYVKVTDTVTKGLPPGAHARVMAEQTILDLAGFYRVGTWVISPDSGNSLSVDLLAGERFNRLEGNVGVQSSGQSVSVGGERHWWDPFVGTRATWTVDPRLSFSLRGDIGGFGLQDGSTNTWQVIGNGSYNFTKHMFLTLGYRTLSTNYTTGSGARRFVYDVRTSGPYLGLGVRF